MPDANGLQSPARVNWTASTVSISDFDSLEQAMAWRRFGPEAAIHRFIMKLRMALLSADYVYVDRNQLLDGICFLSLGPDGIAEALGGRVDVDTLCEGEGKPGEHGTTFSVILPVADD